MLYGYAGKILHVDLATGGVTVEQPPEEFYRTYVGGSAMGVYYLLRNTPAKADPLGPENTLSLMLSAATGVAISGQSRCTATAKSPVTGLVGDSQAGGFWPAELKFAGFDGIVITGRSPRPVYLWVHDGEAELRDATHLWGQITGEAERAIRQELGDGNVQVAQVGPAGERLVSFAAIMNMCNRAFGRTGMGAVMGSKMLKAIAVRGHGRVKAADQKVIASLARRGPQRVRDLPEMQTLQALGTAGTIMYQQVVGGLPTRHFTSGVFDRAEAISGERLSETILKGSDTCYACVVRCKRVVETEFQGRQVDPFYGGPEYETLSALGSYCGVGDLAAVCLANQICAEYGIDTITCGATIAFAMECYERGLLTPKDAGGIELRFGNADALVAVTEQIARREGIGDLLADGPTRAARRIGRGAEDLVVAVKGHELPAHMPQVKRSLALIYAVNPFGADHQSHEHDPAYAPDASALSLQRMAGLGLTHPLPSDVLNEEKVRLALYTQWTYSYLDTANLCQFVWGPSWQLYGPEEMVALMQAVTGWDFTLAELQRVGERRVNLMRAYNAREGVGREADRLPERLFSQPLRGGPSDGVAVGREEFEKALDLYYEMAGWDKRTGNPTRAKLEELGLGWLP